MTQQAGMPRGSGQPGQMTAVMRAAAAPGGPKVLRIGVVRGGRVVQERIVKRRQTVTIGSSEKNLFVTAMENLPPSYKLFELVAGGYVLNITRQMTGRVKLTTGVVDLAEHATSGGPGKSRKLDLTDEARGKVVVGDTTFLFQFVSPPQPQPKPQLPVSVTRGALGIDWRTTTIAAVSFLVHFLSLGLIYSDWMDPVVDSDVDVKVLLENIRNLPAPPQVEEKKIKEKTNEKEEEVKKEAKPKLRKPQPAPEKRHDAPQQKMTTAEVAALATDLDSIDMGVLASNTGKAATADVLDSMDTVSTSALDRAAASGVGVSSGGPGGLKVGSAGAAIAQGAAGPGLKGIGSSGKTAEAGSGKTKVVKGPKGSASIGGASVAGKVAGASRVIARARAGFRACYNRGLANNPDSGGKITLRIKVGPGGEVTGVSANKSGNFSGAVVSCIKSRARSLRFPPPDGGAAVVTVPVSFVAQ